MNLLRLKLVGFRNYDKLECIFEPAAIHILQGKNAQGKTNLMEAIYFLSNLRSFRTSRTANLTGYTAGGFYLEAILETSGQEESLSAYMEEGKKQLRHFGNPVASFSSFVGILNAVLFCPDDLNLFTASPAVRRKFLDTEMIKLSRNHTAALTRYQTLLKERNTLMKDQVRDDRLLDVLEHQLASVQTEIILARQGFVRKLARSVEEIYPRFSGHAEKLDLDYITFVNPDGEIEEQILHRLKSDRLIDYRTGFTRAGCHKDDLVFRLDGHPVRESASQGQRRSILLALKLALCQIIQEQTGQLPVLLLDDVFSELDPERRQTLIDLIPDSMQVFITSADQVNACWTGKKALFYQIENGRIRRLENEPESNGTHAEI